MKKRLFIAYDTDDWDAAVPFASSDGTRRTFEDFYTHAGTRDVETFRANIGWFDVKTHRFRKAWTFRNGIWGKVENPPKPDAVWDRIARRKHSGPSLLETAAEDGLPVFNVPVFRNILDNKLCQYLAFRRFMPESFLAQNKGEVRIFSERLPGDMVAIKQIYGSGGKQVEIRTKDDAERTPLEFPVLVQQLIKASGIPGFPDLETVSDLRIVYVGDTPIYAVSRQAPQGSLMTNIRQGGSGIRIPLERIPEQCRRIADRIASEISEPFNKPNYSLDFMFTTEGDPILIEINTSPGFNILVMHGSLREKASYYDALLDSFFPESDHEEGLG